jgi:hypothetical protein
MPAASETREQAPPAVERSMRGKSANVFSREKEDAAGKHPAASDYNESNPVATNEDEWTCSLDVTSGLGRRANPSAHRD